MPTSTFLLKKTLFCVAQSTYKNTVKFLKEKGRHFSPFLALNTKRKVAPLKKNIPLQVDCDRSYGAPVRDLTQIRLGLEGHTTAIAPTNG